jgi:hypothetical protein
VAAAGAVSNVWRSRPEPEPPEYAYILTNSAPVMDSPAQIRLEVATLRHGERVEVLERTRNWARVRIPDGRRGWIDLARLADGPSYEKGQQLLNELANEPVQAAGHASGAANLRAEPARDAPQLAQLSVNQPVEIFGRRLVERPPQPGTPAAGEASREAWYLVRAEGKAGWVLGRLIALPRPSAIMRKPPIWSPG